MNAGFVGDCAIAGKLSAALGFCPSLTGIEELGGIALVAVLLVNEQSFQIAYRAGGCALNVVVAELALSKADDLIIEDLKEELSLALGEKLLKFRDELGRSGIWPQLGG